MTDSTNRPPFTIRDQFAMAALTGMLAYSVINPMSGNYHDNCSPLQAAKSAYDFADAMMTVRQIPNEAAKS